MSKMNGDEKVWSRSGFGLSTEESGELENYVGWKLSWAVEDPDGEWPEVGSQEWRDVVAPFSKFLMDLPMTGDQVQDLLDLTEIIPESEGEDTPGGRGWYKIQSVLHPDV